MNLDIAKCEIRPPAGEEITRLYHTLWDIFHLDRPVYEQLLAGTFSLSEWRWFTMFSGSQIVGNACLLPIPVWLSGRPVELLAVGAVATVPQYRRMGVAKALMRHIMGIVDREKKASALYTTLPEVYVPFEFQTVAQAYRSFNRSAARFNNFGFESRLITKLNSQAFAAVKEIYTSFYPNGDGKVVRNGDYWSFYQLMFDFYEKPHILLCLKDGRVIGYIRTEKEDDRVLISELCCEPTQTAAAEAMLKFACDFAAGSNLSLMSLALPPAHFAWDIFKQNNVELSPEVGGYRETFMVRQPVGGIILGLDRLQWSLADKF